MIPSTHGTTVPIVSKVEYTLIDISEDGYVTLMNENGETREDLQLPNYPENYAEELKEEFKNKQLIVTVLKACGNEQIISHKEENL